MNALHPGLNALVDRSLLTGREAADLTALASAIQDAVTRGEMTLAQADALGQLLGVRYAANTNGRRARRSLQ
jgi:hypothetical protein